VTYQIPHSRKCCVHLVGYQGSLLWVASKESNYRCCQILWAIQSFERGCSAEAPRIGQQEGRDLPSRQRYIHLYASAKNYSNFPGMFCRILRIVLTLFHWIIISSALFKILLMETIFQMRMPSKFILSGFLQKNLRRSRRREKPKTF